MGLKRASILDLGMYAQYTALTESGVLYLKPESPPCLAFLNYVAQKSHQSLLVHHILINFWEWEGGVALGRH